MSSDKTLLRLPNTLTFWLTLWYASAFVFCLIASLIGLYLWIGEIYDERRDDDLQEDVIEFRMLLDSHGISRLKEEISRELGAQETSEGCLILRASKYSLKV